MMLQTDRLVLRPWHTTEASIQRGLWAERDPRVPAHRRLDADGSPTVADLAGRIEASAPSEGPTPGLLAAELRSTGAVVGYCGLIENSRGPLDEPELAFEFFRSAWGNGYATEASWAIIHHAREAGYGRLWATVREWNLASRRVLEKLGFVMTGRIEPDARHGDTIFTTREL